MVTPAPVPPVPPLVPTLLELHATISAVVIMANSLPVIVMAIPF
jgi:hypothetical protein